MITIQNVYSVAQVNAYIKNMFMQDFMLQSIFIRGEVSNCKYHSSGHIYFTLKDDKGIIACVMFAGNRNGLKFTMKEGMQVVVGGSIDVYERDGKYQVYAKQILQDGAGYLNEKFEELKKELKERGMFDAQYKCPVPKYIHTLGVVTAPTGAAIQDIINVSKRRNPGIQIILYPAIVQGDMAAESIVNGIHALEQANVDVMIVGRGGGSLEDLWAFNEEIVAQAIFDCRIPIISAVGHETDTTIADFVSDLRAPTPSAAAELAVYDACQVMMNLQEYKDKLGRQIKLRINESRMRSEKNALKLHHLSPENKIRTQKMEALKLEEGLHHAMENILKDRRHRLALYIEQMKGMSPLLKLNQGYSFTEDKDGKPLKKAKQVHIGDSIVIQVSDGRIFADVTKTEILERE